MNLTEIDLGSYQSITSGVGEQLTKNNVSRLDWPFSDRLGFVQVKTPKKMGESDEEGKKSSVKTQLCDKACILRF